MVAKSPEMSLKAEPHFTPQAQHAWKSETSLYLNPKTTVFHFFNRCVVNFLYHVLHMLILDQ